MAVRWLLPVALSSGHATLCRYRSVERRIAPQRPIRSFGGFLQLGLPLSRWFNADPHGHNAGWQLQFTVGKDQVVDRDLNNPGATSIGCILVNGVSLATYRSQRLGPIAAFDGQAAIGTL